MEEPFYEQTSPSYQSKVSIQSQQTIDSVALRSQMKLYKMQISLDEEQINNAWTGFGMYLCRCLRQGRAVSVPQFGLFTFSSREVNLEGTTNEFNRDKDVREPVFMISKDFSKGLDLKPAVYRSGILRPLVLSTTSGRIQQTVCNYSEIQLLTKLAKENIKYSVERIIRQLEDKIRSGEDCVQMLIPSIGTWIYKRGQVCVKFQDFIKRDIAGLLKLGIDERRRKNHSNLTASTLIELQESYQNKQIQDTPKTKNFLTSIDDDARDYLQNYLQVDTKFEEPPNEGDTMMQSILAQEATDNITQPLTKDAYKQRLYECHFLIFLNRKHTKSIGTSEEELIFDKWKFILRSKNLKPYDLFSSMIGHIYGIQGTDRRTLNSEQFGKCLIRFNISFEDEKDNQILFRYLDSNKDKNIDLEEWNNAFTTPNSNHNLKREQQALEQLRDVIRKNNLTIEDLFLTMEIKKQKESDQIFLDEFRNGLIKLNINKNQCELICKSLFKNSNTIILQQIIDSLKISTQLISANASSQTPQSDSIESLFQKMKEQLIKQLPQEASHYQYLIEQFEKLDISSQGTLDIANFKTCLLKANLELTLDEISRITRHAEKTNYGTIDYCKFCKQVNNSLRTKDEVDSLPHLAEQIKKWILKNNSSVDKLLTELLSRKENKKASFGQDSKKLRIVSFASSIKELVSLNLSEREIQLASECIDIDKDGFIDKYDLETFINRYSLFDEQLKQPSLLKNMSASATPIVFSRTMSGAFNFQASPQSTALSKRKGVSLHQKQSENTKMSIDKLITQSITRLYPTTNMDITKIDVIVKELKKAISQKRISVFEVFKTLDSNGDGFISYGEFEENIGKIVQFSPNAKEGLFSYLDHLKIGLFDYPRFSFVLSKMNLPLEQANDNWEWQHDILQKIREWKEQTGLNDEEAFKIVDRDFDGFVSKEDLGKFLHQQFKISQENNNSSKLERLFKLLDQYKKGFVQKHDFAKIFTGSLKDLPAPEKSTRSSSFFNKQSDKFGRTSSTNLKMPSPMKEFGQSLKPLLKQNKNLNLGNTLQVEDWMVSCCQQLALILSRNFESLSEAYEFVSNHQNKLEYSQFKAYTEKFNVLSGFNLTENLLQQLFAFIDPHKKGFITESDWISALSIYKESQDVPLSDLQDLVYFTFRSIDETFEYFKQGKKYFKKHQNTIPKPEIDKEQFKGALKNLFSTIYTENTLSKLWELTHLFLSIPADLPLSIDHFIKLFPQIHQQQSSRYSSRKRLGVVNIDEQRFSENFKSNSLSTSNLISYNNFPLRDDIINTFKNLVLSKNVDLYEIFQIKCKTSDIISNCEFKNIISKLKLGLSSRDIDYVLIFADPTSPSQINWKTFIKKLKFSDSEQQLINRSKERIQLLKECLYGYMISPKDAFQEFDQSKQGVMTLEDFRFFLAKVALIQRNDVPSYSISKDMFDHIDIKRDGIIDLDEWQQAFMKYPTKQGENNSEQEKERDRLAFSKFHKQKFETLAPLMTSASPSRSTSNSKFRDSLTSREIPRLSTMYSQNICDVVKNNGQTPLAWERSSEYDQALYLIARNRKYLISKFEALKSNQNDKSLLSEQVKSILKEFLAEYNIKPSDSKLDVLSDFAVKSGRVNYDFMIDAFKNRLSNKHNPPK